MRQFSLCKVILVALTILLFTNIENLRGEEAVVVDPVGDDGGIRITGELDGDSAKLAIFNDKARPVDIYIGNERICILGGADTKIPSSITDTVRYIDEFLKGEYEVLSAIDKETVVNLSSADELRIDCYGPFPVVVITPSPAPVLALLSGRLDDLRALHERGELDRIVGPTTRAFIFDIIIPVVKLSVGLNKDDCEKLAIELYEPFADLILTMLQDLANADGEQAVENALFNAVKILERMSKLVVNEIAGVATKEMIEKLTVALEFLGRLDAVVELGRVSFDQISAPMHVQFVVTREEPIILLDVPYVSQGTTNWCSAASQAMLLKYYGIDKNIWDIASDYGWGPQDGTIKLRMSIDNVKSYLDEQNLKMDWCNWVHLPLVRQTTCSSDQIFSWIRVHLHKKRPILMLLSPTEADSDFPGHAVVAVGYEDRPGARKLYIHDPSGALTDKLKSSVKTRIVPACVRVDWDEFFEVRKGIFASWLGAVIDVSPEPLFASLQLGNGRVFSNPASGLTAIELQCGTGPGQDILGAIKMDSGLCWRSLGSDATSDTAPPKTWKIGPGACLTAMGGTLDIDFPLACIAVLDPRVQQSSYQVSLKLSGPKSRTVSAPAAVNTGGIAPVGGIWMQLDDLPSGQYELSAVVETVTGQTVNPVYSIDLPPLSLEVEPSPEIGMLDCVLCIDKSGSMADDIEAVQDVLDEVLKELNTYASENNISLQLGLVTYTRHDDVDSFGAQWLQAQPLTSDIEKIRQSIADIRILGAGAGGGGWEDMYGALLCGMGARDLLENEELKDKYGQPDGSGNLLDMGWRQGACKICIPIGDEPPSDPDWKDRNLQTVATRAEELDPVHMYPIVVQGPIESWLLGTSKAMNKLADRTGGDVTRINEAKELPEALVKTVKLAVRRHRSEVWRKEHQPYMLYGMAVVIGVVVIFAFAAAFIAQFRKRPEQPA